MTQKTLGTLGVLAAVALATLATLPPASAAPPHDRGERIERGTGDRQRGDVGRRGGDADRSGPPKRRMDGDGRRHHPPIIGGDGRPPIRHYRPAPRIPRIYLEPRYDYRLPAPRYYYYDGQLSCAVVKDIIANKGYRNIRAFDCSGESYGFYATRAGRRYVLIVDADSGAVIQRLKR